MSEFFEVSGHCFNKTSAISGSYNSLTFQLTWTLTAPLTAVTFSGTLRSLGAKHLVVVGRWSSSDCSGHFIFSKQRDSLTATADPSLTQPLRVNDDFKGGNIELSDDGQVARRIASYSDAVCSSAAPLAEVDGCRSYEVRAV